MLEIEAGLLERTPSEKCKKVCVSEEFGTVFVGYMVSGVNVTHNNQTL